MAWRGVWPRDGVSGRWPRSNLAISAVSLCVADLVYLGPFVIVGNICTIFSVI